MNWILTFLFGQFMKGEGATKAAGAANGVAFYGAIAGGAMWILGPGREWSITLNALELAGISLAVSLVLEYVRRLPAAGP